MSSNKIYAAPKSLELENFVFNPLAVLNVCPTLYLIYRQEHQIKEAMNKFTNVEKGDLEKRKLVPKEFKPNAKDGKLFHRKDEEKSVIVTKVTTYQLKILSLMDELIEILREPPIFTDHIDSFKQRKLFADFIIRFTRNYIYEIDRNIEEIHFYQIDHYSYFERSTNHLINKVCNLFAVIMRAMHTYRKQLAKMNNENSEKLLHFTELIISGINVCTELKIFDEDDMLIKLLLEKTGEFIAFLRYATFDGPTYDNKQITKKSISASSLAKDIFPTCDRYIMYASKSKKVKAVKSTMTFLSKNGNGKCDNHHQRSQEPGKIQTMFESQVCLGCSEKSSACDALEEAIKQNNMQFNDELIGVNYGFLEDQIENAASANASSENALELFSSDE